MFHIYLIMKVGNFIYYNIKELVAISLISIRNWNYLHTLDDNFLFGFCKNRTLNHKFPTECGRWQYMCTEHGLTRSGLEPTIYSTRGEHANDYTTDESLWWAFLVCFSANTYIVQGRIQDFKFLYIAKKSLFMCLLPKVDRALHNVFCIVTLSIVIYVDNRGGSKGGGGAPPPNIWKNKIFLA
jgi:hypothetical protein